MLPNEAGPSKVVVFSWQFLQDRFPSRENLFKRRVIVDLNDVPYPMCGNLIESTSRLFVICDLASTT